MTSQTIQEYLSYSPGTKENANNTRSHSGMESFIADEAIKDYVLANKYPPWVGQMYRSGDIHFHNLTKGFLPYCFGADLTMLLSKGLITDRTISKPAKHLDSAVDHMVNFLGINQQEWAGAQAFSHVNTLLAPLAVGLDYKQIRQSMQRLIYNLNLPSRSGYQTVFSNMIFDMKTPKMLADVPAIIGGVATDNYYADFEDESEMIHMAFWEELDKGDGAGNIFTFPIPTENLTPSTKFDSDVMQIIMKNTAKIGQAYWMNYRGTGVKEDTVQAMCCRLNLDLSELPPAGGRWAYEGGTGSIGVVTINMGRIGHLAKSDAELFERIEFLMEKARDILMIKENIITASRDVDMLMPLARIYNIDFNRFFRTIGLVGFNEMFLNYCGSSLVDNVPLAEKILRFMRDVTKRFQRETGRLFNFEMTPAEGCSWSLAVKDRKTYPNIITSGPKDAPYYSALIPPSNAPISLVDQIEIGNTLLNLFTGGTVFRVQTDGTEPSVESTTKFVDRLASNTQIPYFDLTGTISSCPHCKTKIRGSHKQCPNDGHTMEQVTRVTGYFRPISSFNPGKLSEFEERMFYNIND